MFTEEELKTKETLYLHRLLLENLDHILAIWRSVPQSKLPTEEQEMEISEMENYTAKIANILIERGALPPDWGKR